MAKKNRKSIEWLENGGRGMAMKLADRVMALTPSSTLAITAKAKELNMKITRL